MVQKQINIEMFREFLKKHMEVGGHAKEISNVKIKRIMIMIWWHESVVW